MTEKEKMLRGGLYDANYNPELIDERQECKVKCFKFIVQLATIPTLISMFGEH